MQLVTQRITLQELVTMSELKEILRVREALVSYFLYDNKYGFTDQAWYDYFMWFNQLAAIRRGR